jgi:hypothetical protein
MQIEVGAFQVMERGYLDFSKLFKLHQVGAFFISQAKRGVDVRRVYSSRTDRTTAVASDQKIAPNGLYPILVTIFNWRSGLRSSIFEIERAGSSRMSGWASG